MGGSGGGKSLEHCQSLPAAHAMTAESTPQTFRQPLTFWHEPKGEVGSARWHSLPVQHLVESRHPNLPSATHCE